MEYRRVIPCLDVKEGRVVKGVSFVDLVDAGDPVQLAAAYVEAGADEVVFLDITATTEGRKTTVDMAKRVSDKVPIPFAVGGGFKTVEDMGVMLAAGADRVGINSAALHDPALLERAAAAYGREAVVCAIDAKRVAGDRDKWVVYINGGQTATGFNAVEWAAEAQKRGAGSILLTSIDRDGVKDGYDLALTRAVARAVDIPVIASGGAGKLEHFAQGILEGEADAVLAASVFHFGELSIKEVKEYMAGAGIPVRLDERW